MPSHTIFYFYFPEMCVRWFQMVWRRMGSTPTVGSSRMISWGSCNRATARLARLDRYSYLWQLFILSNLWDFLLDSNLFSLVKLTSLKIYFIKFAFWYQQWQYSIWNVLFMICLHFLGRYRNLTRDNINTFVVLHWGSWFVSTSWGGLGTGAGRWSAHQSSQTACWRSWRNACARLMKTSLLLN